MRVREAINLVAADGWYLARTRGSRRHYKHPTKPGNVTIAGDPAIDIPSGALNSILRQAGMKN
jgi:predicted RNA binding protein YcfA (HicA-like mRNA interferase family)